MQFGLKLKIYPASLGSDSAAGSTDTHGMLEGQQCLQFNGLYYLLNLSSI